jgi:predicted transposase/invertase (TIGR01784 family)
MMGTKRTLISFDWALKRLLRQKANFEILEGFLSVLLKRDIVILNILESEANAEIEGQKINRVDLLVENEEKERIIIELQYSQEIDYFQRMLFATAKHLTETFEQGQAYQHIKKVYSINLIYFDLGRGTDYVYHGKTEFRGIHTKDILRLSKRQQELFIKESVHEIYPEYYVIKINNFNDIAKDSLDEWIYYFKHDEVKDEFNAKGLSKVRDYLRIEGLNEADRSLYNKHLAYLSTERSVIATAKIEGHAEGKAEGRAEGKAEGKAEGREEMTLETARKMKSKGFDNKTISEITGLSIEILATL